jgi:hypothetical protein
MKEEDGMENIEHDPLLKNLITISAAARKRTEGQRCDRRRQQQQQQQQQQQPT